MRTVSQTRAPAPIQSTNTFAALQEEKKIARQHQKQQREEQKRLEEFQRRNAAAASMPKAALGSQRWADVIDDEDEDDDTFYDDVERMHRQTIREEHRVDDEEDEEEEEEEEEEEDDGDAVEATDGDDRVPGAEAGKTGPAAVRVLTKKERKMQKQKELEEMEVLLCSFKGPECEVDGEVDSVAEPKVIDNDDAASAAAVAKKKKKKRVSDKSVAGEPHVEVASAVSKTEALARLKQNMAAKKSDVRKAGVVPTTVIEEARKRAEGKKAKSKKDKQYFER